MIAASKGEPSCQYPFFGHAVPWEHWGGVARACGWLDLSHQINKRRHCPLDYVESKSHHHNDNRQRDRTRRPHWFLWWRTARTAGTPQTSNSYHCCNLAPGFANPEFGNMFSNCTHLSWGQEFFATEPSSNNQHLKGNKQTLFQLRLRRRCLTMEKSRTKNWKLKELTHTQIKTNA